MHQNLKGKTYAKCDENNWSDSGQIQRILEHENILVYTLHADTYLNIWLFVQ